jgi:hypothetical protein
MYFCLSPPEMAAPLINMKIGGGIGTICLQFFERTRPMIDRLLGSSINGWFPKICAFLFRGDLHHLINLLE